MKTSKFNVFVSGSNAEQLVYNTLRGSITKINASLAKALKSGNLAVFKFPQSFELAKELEEQGILISENFDELRAYEKIHQRWKVGSEKVEINVLLTYDCNFECPYCYQGRGETGEKIHGFKYMSPELLERTKHFIKRTTAERGAKKLELVLYGGEPFLPGAIEMGRELTEDLYQWTISRNIGFGLHVLSNGSRINEEDVEWLSHFGARLQIPVDGDPEMHDRYRFYKVDRRGSFDDIAKVLAMTRGTNIETHIRVSLTDETYPTMEGLLDELKSRDLTHVFPDFCYINAFTDACADFKDHTLSDLTLFKVMPDLWRKAHERGFPLDIRPQILPLPCSSVADGSFIVDPYGEIYKCWELVGLKEHVVGKIGLKGQIEKTVAYGEVIMRNPVNIEQCRNHSYLPSCGGGCVCKAYWENKTYHAPGCGSAKYLLKDKIRVYVETLDLSDKPMVQAGEFRLRKIEGRQEAQMSHCYVLV